MPVTRMPRRSSPSATLAGALDHVRRSCGEPNTLVIPRGDRSTVCHPFPYVPHDNFELSGIPVINA
jgi:hypothetical protein